MDEPKLIAAASDLPYPPVAVDGKNPAYQSLAEGETKDIVVKNNIRL